MVDVEPVLRLRFLYCIHHLNVVKVYNDNLHAYLKSNLLGQSFTTSDVNIVFGVQISLWQPLSVVAIALSCFGVVIPLVFHKLLIKHFLIRIF